MLRCLIRDHTYPGAQGHFEGFSLLLFQSGAKSTCCRGENTSQMYESGEKRQVAHRQSPQNQPLVASDANLSNWS